LNPWHDEADFLTIFLLFILLQQLFRSQNPGLTNAGASGQNGGPLPQALPLAQAQQQFLAAQQSAAYAAQQAAPYIVNPGQEANPYMGTLINVPQYYGVAAPWGVYPSTHLIPQQGSQPRRPLTPSQQGAENQQYQVSFDRFPHLFRTHVSTQPGSV
jgi:hypothetical protein